MKVLGSPQMGFGDFELNIQNVTMRSDDIQNIILPYCGELPSGIGNVLYAQIYLNVQLIQDARVVLIISRLGKKPIRRPVSSSVSEIVSILDQFFGQDDTGLSPYWTGIWHGNYITWKQVMENPVRLVSAISAMTQEQRDKLRKILDTEM